MNNGPILDVDFISHANAVDIAPYYCIEPDAALVSHFHIANNGTIRRYKTIFSPFWINVFYR
jgi:hypothetical protein